MRYLLLNKDKPLLLFSCSLDELGYTEAAEIKWYTDVRPYGYEDLASFLEGRKAPKHRKHIEKLLTQYGCDELEGFLRVTHALSLNDTFWVKEEGSSLNWPEVSLFQNPFNELISMAAFDGILSDTDFSSTSPEFGTDGYYAKCWVRDGEAIRLLKAGSETHMLEPLSEFFASQVASVLCPNSVRYDLQWYHEQLVSSCNLFTSEKVGLAKAATLGLRGSMNAKEIVEAFERFGGEDTIRRMYVLDAVILNTDRHLGNFGALYDTETLTLLGAAPLFDNNRSLMFSIDTEALLERHEWYVRHSKPRFGTNYIAAARGVMTDEIRNDLRNMRGFSLAQHKTIRAEQARLDILNRIINNQIDLILGIGTEV